MSAAAAIAALRAAYPRADFPDRSVELYARMLARYDDDELQAAVERLIRRSTFLPSIAEIGRDIAEAKCGLPTPPQAWDIVLSGALRDAPEAVRESARSCGGRWSIVHSEHPETVRAQFVRDYTSRREQAIQEASGSAAVVLQLPPAGEDRQLDQG